MALVETCTLEDYDAIRAALHQSLIIDQLMSALPEDARPEPQGVTLLSLKEALRDRDETLAKTDETDETDETNETLDKPSETLANSNETFLAALYAEILMGDWDEPGYVSAYYKLRAAQDSPTPHPAYARAWHDVSVTAIGSDEGIAQVIQWRAQLKELRELNAMIAEVDSSPRIHEQPVTFENINPNSHSVILQKIKLKKLTEELGAAAVAEIQNPQRRPRASKRELQILYYRKLAAAAPEVRVKVAA